MRTSPSDTNLEAVLERLDRLVQEAEEEDDVLPTDYALAETRRLLRAAFPLVRSTFPRAVATSDGRGWIYLYWRKPDRMVQLTVHADSGWPPSIYHSDGDTYDVEPNVTPARVAHWLNWFADTRVIY
jgi:hypothetical protein